MNKNDNATKNVINDNVINDNIINNNVIHDNINNDFEFDFSMCHGTYCFYCRYKSFYKS